MPPPLPIAKKRATSKRTQYRGWMLSVEGMRFFETTSWRAIFPGIFISAVAFGVNLFGDALRNVPDPKSGGC
jgi:peptide/nickel transport system permease protein